MREQWEEDFSQGARCGYVEGKGRAGQYVIGEDEQLSWDAAYAQTHLDGNHARVSDWAKGYRRGYRLAAEGSELPERYR